MSEPPQPGTLSLNDYRQHEFFLVGRLNRLYDTAHRWQLTELEQQIDSCLRSIQRDSFSVAIVGEFKRGKSTLINALLGESVLPTSVLPTTATLNRVTYDTHKRVQIIYKPTAHTPEQSELVPIDQLASYVSKRNKSSAAIAALVKEAIVYYPTLYCKNNVNIIDTPGLNDSATMTEITMSVMPQVDAAVLVIMADSPFSDVESQFLRYLLELRIGKVFFVANAIDRIPAPERAEVLQAIVERIKQAAHEYAEAQFGTDSDLYHAYLREFGEPRVFGLSGKEALQARRTSDHDLLVASGFETFERGLNTFLAEDRGRVTLRAISQRTVNFAQKLDQAMQQQQAMRRQQQQAGAAQCQARADAIRAFEDHARYELLILTHLETETRTQVAAFLPAMQHDLIDSLQHMLASATVSDGDLYQASVSNVVRSAQQRFGRLVPSNMQSMLRNQPLAREAEEKPEGMIPALELIARDLAAAFRGVGMYYARQVDELVHQQITQACMQFRELAPAIQNFHPREVLVSALTFTGIPEGTPLTIADNIGQAVLTSFGALHETYYLFALTSAAEVTQSQLITNVSERVRRLNPFGKKLPDTEPVPPPSTTAEQTASFKQHYHQALTHMITTSFAGQDLADKLGFQISLIFQRLRQQIEQSISTQVAAQQAALVEQRRQHAQLTVELDRTIVALDQVRHDIIAIRDEVGQLTL